jgi:hypothetical protein
MRKTLFFRIVLEVTAKYNYFKQKCNAAGQIDFSALHKCVVAIKMLAYGGPADLLDDHLKMRESTVLKTMKEFAFTMISAYGNEYLRSPRSNELEHILQQNKARGFLRMIGSINCMHWEWSTCPTGWAGMYKGQKGNPTEDLMIWHANFGLPGSHNDITILYHSNVFDDLANEREPPVEFHVNGNIYSLGYYLADGIYPEWATLVKTISGPVSNKQKVFTAQQESCRKDVERAFGVLQAKWKIIHRPTRLWHQQTLNTIMRACVILHNMIVEDERGVQLPNMTHQNGPELQTHLLTRIETFPGLSNF